MHYRARDRAPGPIDQPRLLRILVVEDDDDSRELLGDALRLTGAHTIALAKNGDEGIRHLRDDDYDLIVTDIRLPNMSGLEMLDQAQQQGLLAETAIVVCSAEDRLRSKVLLRGATWLCKPVDIDKLWAIVRGLCARTAPLEERPGGDERGIELAPASALPR